MSRSVARLIALAVSFCLAGLGTAGPVLAAARTHKPTSFKVTGLVTSVHGNKVTVLARTKQVNGKTVGHNTLVTLTLTRKTHKHVGKRTHKQHRAAAARSASYRAASQAPTPDAALAPGSTIVATGVVQGGQLTTTDETSTVLPAEALIGTVQSVAGNLVTLSTRDQVDGEHVACDGGAVTVADLTAATFSGPSGNAAAMHPGDTLVVLGESQDHVMLAAKVYSFAGHPSLVAGTVSASDATGKTLTVTPDDGEGDNDSDPASVNPVTVDASHADVVLNGNDKGTSGAVYPAVGDEVLAVGAPGTAANSITADLVFGFSQNDDGPVGHNED